MKNSRSLHGALLGIFLLLGCVSLSAGSGVTPAPAGAMPAGRLEPASLSAPVPALNLGARAMVAWGDDWNWGKGDDWGKDHHRDHDHDGDDPHRHKHYPTPEPSTLLSFGAAILIGGGVVYSRRLNGSKR